MDQALRYLGLMSGTSLDGIDAALVEIQDEGADVTARLKAFVTVPYDGGQRRAIKAAIDGGAREICRLNVELGRWMADAAAVLLAATGTSAASLEAVGSHGQTVWHEPPAGGEAGATLQIGEPAVIAESLGVPVVSDFRARDMAAGGEGAPLVPLVDRLVFSAPAGWRAMQNIGGIANVTLLPPRGASDTVTAFDTGPGIAVIDAVVEILTDGAERYDSEGRRASRGRVHDELLAELLADEYFERPPPKSTGRERYGEPYARELVRRAGDLGISDSNDVVATATALTARTIANAYRLPGLAREPDECIVSGGGSRNPALMAMLASELAPTPVADLSSLGWDPDAKEAAAFAILAHLFVMRRPGNLPSVTGAAGPRVLGKLTPP